jgi:formylglycine-generating enzyme required for sulfatase activity
VQWDSPTEDGRRLFEWLTADRNLTAAWAGAREAGKRRIRLRIDPDAPELHDLPWELLRDGTAGSVPQDLAAGGDTPFSRFLAGPWPTGEPLAERPVELVAGVANPEDLERLGLPSLDVETEQAIVADALRDLTAGQVTLRFLEPPVSLSCLEEALIAGCHILHLVAHGRFSASRRSAHIILSDRHNQAKAASEEQIAGMVGRLSQRPHLIFLSSCQSASRDNADAFRGIAPRLVAAGLPAVVAMQDRVPVETAQAFVRTFFRGLFSHGLVDLAANRARATLLTGEFPGSSIPVLFSRLPENQLLVQMTGDAAPIITPRPFEPQTLYIPPGPFLMGSPEREGAPPWETPLREVVLTGYRIGRYPVTNEQYAVYLSSTGRIATPDMVGWSPGHPPEERLDHPVCGVTWYEALAYCEWLRGETGRHYTLPSEAEWEKAARWTDGRRYPWGNEWDPTCCNHGDGQTTAVDHYSEGASRYGCYDMVGNVREWTRSLWGRTRREPDGPYMRPGAEEPPNALSASRYILRVYRGGGAGDRSERLHAAARSGLSPDHPGPNGRRHGFRVAMMLEQ